MDVHTFPDPDALGRVLAGVIADGLEAAAAEGRQFLLGCPSGRSPAPTYAALALLVRERRLPLGSLTLVMMDEYVVETPEGFADVPDDTHYSCHRFARDELVGRLNAASAASRVTPDRVWFPDPAAPERYDSRVRSAGGVDLFLLASGASDGHIAFNPPGSARSSETRVVRLAEATRVDNMGTFPDFRSLDEVPLFGVTVGIATIAELSKHAVLIATGSHKALAAARISAARRFDPDWPATIVTECRGAALWLDDAAASPWDAQDPG